ncbi:MAG: HNH endonuclease [Coriobacteriia bacterium]|nr:HNH endonuclease [Coriobacteriia bacterium]
MAKVNPRKVKSQAYNKARARLRATTTHCALCGKELDYSLKYPHPLAPVMDHIYPLSKLGGANASPREIYKMDNLQMVHNTCNRQKSDMLPEETSCTNGKRFNQLPVSQKWN